jgi:hypothetical protein
MATVTFAVAKALPQLLITVYAIVAVPGAMPLTMPPAETVAIVVVVLLNVPPVGVDDSVTLLPAHTSDGPVIVPATGSGVTVTFAVTVVLPHELVTVYLITAVPAATPDISPPAAAVATVGDRLLQLPPGVALLSVI